MVKLSRTAPCVELAYRFVTEIQERPFDYRFDKRYIAEAKIFIDVKRDPVTQKMSVAYSIDDVLACAKDVKSRKLGNVKSLNSLRQLFWGDPPYIVQFTTPPPRPPVAETIRYDAWVRRHGKRAIDLDLWDGIYRWDGIRCTPINGALTVGEIVMLLGPEIAAKNIWHYITNRGIDKQARV